MLPREYLKTRFKNLQSQKNIEIVDDPLMQLLSDIPLDEEDYLYSNNLEFESLIENFLINNQYYVEDDHIYIGKLSNPYPNCYLVKGDDLDGCLICITSGLTENSYIIAKYYVLLHEHDEMYITKEQYDAYKQILESDIIRRIHQEYGSGVTPGDLLYYAEILLGKKIIGFINYSANFSAVMDLFNILHEYGHYVCQTHRKEGKRVRSVLKVLASSLYVEICEKSPSYGELSIEEILADIIALYILFEGKDLDKTVILAVLLSVLQLQKMSKDDIYTNDYRLEVFYYFLSKHSKTYRENEQEIKERVREIQQLFNVKEDAISKTEGQVSNGFLKLFVESEATRNDIEYVLEDRVRHMEMLAKLLKERTQISEDEFETF